MEKDKLTVRERLIDFCKYQDEVHSDGIWDKEHVVDCYLKSINQSSGEALTLAPIEAKEKVCKHYDKCIHPYKNRFECNKTREGCYH